MIQLFGGIFQDEKCIQLVILLCEYATLLFQDLYNRCKERFHEHKDVQEKFIKCMQMADDWTDATVVKELRRLAVLNPECENMFQYAFANGCGTREEQPVTLFCRNMGRAACIWSRLSSSFSNTW